MHGMLGHVRLLDRQEGAGAYVQTNILSINGLSPDSLKHCFSKMKAGRRGCDRPAHMRIEGLIALKVYGLGIAVEVRRYGHLSTLFKYAGEGFPSLPAEFHDTCLTLTGDQGGAKLHLCQR